MEIQYLSDLHLSQWNDPILQQVIPSAKILVIAGDLVGKKLESLSDNEDTKPLFTLCDKFEHVFYVPGNHEYYNMKSKQIQPLNTHIRNLHLLNNHSFTINDINFICSTLWGYIRPHEEEIVKNMVNDFIFIRGMTPKFFNQLNRVSTKYIISSLSKDLKNVIISHHLPSYNLISEKWKNNELNPAFACEIVHKLKIKPVAWIHGHSHEYYHNDLNGTLFTRNPIGFRSEGSDHNITIQRVITV